MHTQLFMECLMGKCPTLRGDEKFCANMTIQERSFAGTEVFKVKQRRCHFFPLLFICSRVMESKTQDAHDDMLLTYLPYHNTQTPECGWALRTTQPVKRGTLIIEYMGEVTTMDEVQRRTKEGYTGDHDFYFASLEGHLVLDAGPMGSDARFAK